MTHRRILVLTLFLCAALLALAEPQDQGSRPTGRQSGWYSSRSRPRPSYNQPTPDDDEQPTFGTREDYGSRPGRTRTGGSSLTNTYRRPGGYGSRQPQPSAGTARGYQPVPDNSRGQPGYPGYGSRQPPPPYDPRPPVYNPRPVYPPRPQPRPYPPPVNPQPQPQPRPYPQPVDPIVSRPDELVNLNVGEKYLGPDNLNTDGTASYLKGKKKDPRVANNCALTCRGLCTIRDEDCNCIRNVTCYNEHKHRLDPNAPETIQVKLPDYAQCPNRVDCGECGYTVIWPDGWCLCETDPNCSTNPSNRKRDVDLQKLILQRDAHMAELKRASRHSQKTKRHTLEN